MLVEVFLGLKPSASAWVKTKKNFFLLNFASIFCFFLLFLPFTSVLCKTHEFSLFELAFGVRSIQTLVKIYNKYPSKLYNKNLIFTLRATNKLGLFKNIVVLFQQIKEKG